MPPPAVPHQRVPRPAATRRLVGAHGARLVHVAAPAGYGKTSLIAEWAAAEAGSRTFAHVPLAEVDDHPAALWAAVLAAFDGVLDRDLGAGLSISRNSRRDPPLPRLLNALATLRCPVVLVFDGHHRLEDPGCLRLLATLIDRFPPAVQVVLVGRTDAAVPLARRHAAGDLVELRARDLRLDASEAAALVRAIAGLRLREPELDTLLERTEGWPVAIRFAALGLREAPDPAAFVSGFSGTGRHLHDFMTEEVLRPLKPETRRFLLMTSVLDDFTLALGRAVADLPRAGRPLTELERSDLLVPLDDDGQRYRQLRPLREAARDDLERQDPGLVPVLHARACDWYLEHGLVGPAIGQALAGGDTGRARLLLARDWTTFAAAGELDVLRDWLAAVGWTRLSVEPALAVCAAWCSAAVGDRQGVRRWLRVAEASDRADPLPDGMPSAAFAVALTRALLGSGTMPHTLTAAEKAAALVPDPASDWYGPARAVLGYCRYLSGDANGAVWLLEEIVQGHTNLPVFRILTLAALSLSLGELGRSAQAGRLARTAADLAETCDLTSSVLTTPAATALGLALVREGRDAEGLKVLDRALEVRRTEGLAVWPTLDILLAAARARLAAGDRAGARAAADEARGLLAFFLEESPRFHRALDDVAGRLTGAAAPAHASGEQLTEREREVLRLLRTRLSLREIGHELFVSANTVKTHTRSIYRKLDATSREEALRRASERGLL